MRPQDGEQTSPKEESSIGNLEAVTALAEYALAIQPYADDEVPGMARAYELLLNAASALLQALMDIAVKHGEAIKQIEQAHQKVVGIPLDADGKLVSILQAHQRAVEMPDKPQLSIRGAQTLAVNNLNLAARYAMLSGGQVEGLMLGKGVESARAEAVKAIKGLVAHLENKAGGIDNEKLDQRLP